MEDGPGARPFGRPEPSEQDDDASLWGAVVRTFTNLTRPLANMASQAAVQAKYGLLLASKKCAVALKQSIQNPTKLFRRQALSPLDSFRGLGFAALRSELQAGGTVAFVSRGLFPYMANSITAVSMFQTYTAMNQFVRSVHGLSNLDPAARHLCCEGAAGAAAGVMQATLSTPLYNVKLHAPQGHIRTRLISDIRHLWARRGLGGLYQNYRLVLAQEVCSLAAFFVSYEWLKGHATRAVRTFDASGDKDGLAWAAAASGAGIVLAATGTPFENVHEWHADRRGPLTPQRALSHFLQATPPRDRPQVLLRGLGRKLPLAPLAGLPLLAYEAMLHVGLAPALAE